MVTRTTLAAYSALDPGPLYRKILQVMDIAGIDGCIHDEVRAVFPMELVKDGTINTRYTEMERKSLIFRTSDERCGASGNDQTVWRHHKFAAAMGVTLPTGMRPKDKYLDGLKDMAKVILPFKPDTAMRRAMTAKLKSHMK